MESEAPVTGFSPANIYQQQLLIQTSLLTVAVAELALQQAQQAGEEVTRPLSREQLSRALDVMALEADHVFGLLIDRWNAIDAGRPKKPDPEQK